MPTDYLIAQSYDHMWGGGMSVGMWIVMLVFWLLIAALVALAMVWLVRSLRTGSGRHRQPTPLELLERRFAEGSISVQESNERRRILEAAVPPAGERVRSGGPGRACRIITAQIRES